ncbi:hypothetical protein DFQ26_005881 [Actinomortierella ambigua]|nr:hypothetical protein DFQ26_005881 [Actinomortierella ambigua]
MHDAAKVSSPKQLELRQDAIRREIATLQRLRHPHLIQFRKTREENGNLYIVMETTAKDSLTAFVESSGLDWSTRFGVAQEIARGLEYLHHNNVIHQDLRSDNVLLTKSMTVKLRGFGTAQRMPASTRILAGSADSTVRWMAPELFIGTPMHSTKSDIFAFGMVLWQMAAKCSLPFKSYDNYQAAMRIQNGDWEEIPEGTPTAYRTWIERCWVQEPCKRPEAGAILSFSLDSETALVVGSSAPMSIDLSDSHQRQEKFDSMLQTILILGLNATAMPHTCTVLTSQCESACAIALQVSLSDIDEFLLTVLQRITVFLNKMSTSFYTMLRSAEYLKTEMKNLRSDLFRAVSAQLESSSLEQLGPHSSAIEISSMYRTEVDKMKQELLDRQNELKVARRSESKARAIYNHGVTYIAMDALARWETDQVVEVDEARMRSVRFGLLGMATVGGRAVLIKRVDAIQRTTKTDTIKRSKAIAHGLRHCKGIMKIEYIKLPDLVIYGPIKAETLDVYLAQQPGLSLEAKWTLAFKVASTISYIHECKIIHRNIRAESVFMVTEASGMIEPKLAGFEVYDLDLWDAPEKRHRGSSFATDVFAFGVLMYEIAMQQPLVWINRPSVPSRKEYEQKASQWVAEANSFSPSPKYIELMQQCLSFTYTDRPAMSTIFDTLVEGY